MTTFWWTLFYKMHKIDAPYSVLIGLSCVPSNFHVTDQPIHCKKRLAIFPSPGGMSLTKLSLAGENLIIPGQGAFGK
jgi:hypothetical protein